MENERKEKVVDMYLVEVAENACMTKADIRRILDHLTEDEIFPMECFARKKHSSAIGFISASFAKYLQFDYDELENFVASILDTDGSSETDGYAYHGYRIFVEKL